MINPYFHSPNGKEDQTEEEQNIMKEETLWTRCYYEEDDIKLNPW